jgi:hypothetical protein
MKYRKEYIDYNYYKIKWKIFNRPVNKEHIWRHSDGIYIDKHIEEINNREIIKNNKEYIYIILKQINNEKLFEWEKIEKIGILFSELPIQYWSHISHYYKNDIEKKQLINKCKQRKIGLKKEICKFNRKYSNSNSYFSSLYRSYYPYKDKIKI